MSIRSLVIRGILFLVGLFALSFLVLVGGFHALFYEPNRANGTLVSSGQDREYLLHVPPNYDPTKPTPLVISLHAAASWPGTQMQITRWNDVADENGFFVVYPSGGALGGRGTGVQPKVWGMNTEVTRLRDIDFIADLIDSLETAYNIDATRIYANGFSLGGGMIFALSCRLSRRIAAVGAVAAAEVLPSRGRTGPRDRWRPLRVRRRG